MSFNPCSRTNSAYSNVYLENVHLFLKGKYKKIPYFSSKIGVKGVLGIGNNTPRSFLALSVSLPCEDPRFVDNAQRCEHQDLLDEAIVQWTSAKPATEALGKLFQ